MGYWLLVLLVSFIRGDCAGGILSAPPNPNPNPIPNPQVVFDLRNKETLNSFSYIGHSEIRTSDPLD